MENKNIALYTKELYYCNECPYCKIKKQYFDYSNEEADLFVCSLSNDEEIGIFDWNEQGKRDTIPDWCKILKK